MQPTALGGKAALFLTFIVTTFVASPYTNLFFLLLSFLIVVLVSGTAWTWCALRGVSGGIADVRPFPAGRSATARLGIRTGRARVFGLELVVRLRASGWRRRTTVLARYPALDANSEHRLEAPLPSLPRGIHAVRGAWVRTSHPFGLWWRRVRVDVPEELVAHPTPTGATGRSGRDADALDRLASLGSRSPDSPAGLRDWHVGDALHAIDWRATARRARPIVKELEQESGRGITVTFDRRCDPDTFERCLSMLAALCRQAREFDRPLALTTQGLDDSFGTARRTLDELLRWLAAASPLPASAAPPRVTSPDALRLPEPVPAGSGGAPT